MSHRTLTASVFLVVALLALSACQIFAPAPTPVAPTSVIASAATVTPTPLAPPATATTEPTPIAPTPSDAASPSPDASSPTPSPSPMPSPTGDSATPTAAAQATSSPTPHPTATPTSPATPAASTGTSIGGSPAYLDDRSDPAAVVLSYYNAINRDEYDRAYSYWESGAPGLQSYASFKQGFADTKSVHVTLGQIRGDAGAGQMYGSVPAILTATQQNNSIQAYVGCFTLHLANPQIQDQPPFDPWAISSAKIQQPAAGANLNALLGTICANQGVPTAAQPKPSVNDISASRYLDDRSTPEQVLRSLFNAVNRKEYDRAYSYWMPGTPASQLPPYVQFKAGYANTASVTIKFGHTTVGGAAGSLYFGVPTTLVAKTTGGQTQTFVGCYVVHLGQPAIQDAPPYDPMAVQSATVKQVANNANTTALMTTACPIGG